MFSWIKIILYGVCFGITNLVPGISGATIMVILRAYDRLISSISNLRKEWRKSLSFLGPLVIGALISILLLSSLVNYLMKEHLMVTNCFFIGVILGSTPMIYKRATMDSFKAIHLLPFAVGCAITVLSGMLHITGADAAVGAVNLWSAVELVFCGFFASIAMLLPGISGSFVMVLFGKYTLVISAISEFDFAVLLPVGIGIVLGLVLGAKLIDFLFRTFPQATYFMILGFILGSLYDIGRQVLQSPQFGSPIPTLLGVLVLSVGMGAALFFNSKKLQSLLAKREQKSTSDKALSTAK